MYITAQGPRLRNVEWDVKLYYTVPYYTIPYDYDHKTSTVAEQRWCRDATSETGLDSVIDQILWSFDRAGSRT